MFKIKNFNLKKNPAMVIGAIIAVLLLAKPIFKKIKDWINSMNAKADQAALQQETFGNGTSATTNTTGNTRFTYVEGIVKSVIDLMDSFDQDEKGIVTEMNKLSSAAEVVYASNYYSKSKGGSLKAALKDSLVDDWRSGGFLGGLINPNAAGGAFKDLQKIVQDNLL
jgi:hypothetical protein